MLEMMIRSRKNSKDDTLITEIAEQENTPPGVRNGSFSHESKGDESTEGKILRLISIAFKWLKITFIPHGITLHIMFNKSFLRKQPNTRWMFQRC